MRNPIELVDAMNKIESLVIAAQFLTSSDDERKTQSELLSIIEDVARNAQKSREDDNA
ncbi:hypothetical protein [Pantoea sp. X85]|uniref:hypothetical protein n=1 Tax=Pantoea sp. X85 TaxID=3037258 RepID=UPI002413687A|nr:hypothetical protein [Pantoea sp. X85]WFL67422.1 hypothetical protein P6287_19140 [Pantoea sp. X85]